MRLAFKKKLGIYLSSFSIMKKDNILFFVLAIFLVLVAILSIRKMNQNTKQNLNSETNINYDREEESMPASLSANKKMNKPEMIIDQNKQYTAVLHTTMGDITIGLKTKETPITANNFIYLASDLLALLLLRKCLFINR